MFFIRNIRCSHSCFVFHRQKCEICTKLKLPLNMVLIVRKKFKTFHRLRSIFFLIKRHNKIIIPGRGLFNSIKNIKSKFKKKFQGETSGRSYGRSASIKSNPEIKRLKCSSTPSIKKYFPVLQTKSLVNVDGGEKASTETISEDTSSLSTDNLETKIRRHFNAPR